MKKIKKYLFIIPFLIFSSNVFAHDPRMVLPFIAGGILFYAIPIFIISFFSTKLIFYLFRIKNKFFHVFIHWIIPLFLSIPNTIFFTYKLMHNMEFDITKDTFCIWLWLLVFCFVEFIIFLRISLKILHPFISFKNYIFEKVLPYVKKCIKGEEKLWIVFWILNVLLGFIIYPIFPFVIIFLFPLFFEKFFEISFVGIIQSFLMSISVCFGGTLLLLTIFYVLWSLISCLMCSKNVKNKLWMWITRLLIIGFIARVVYQKVTGF